MKYRKKPIVVEAEQFLPWADPWPEGVKRKHISGNSRNFEGEEVQFVIQTLEGEMIVSPEDFIITGVIGEKYPCKPDIFLATYDPVFD